MHILVYFFFPDNYLRNDKMAGEDKKIIRGNELV